MITQLVTSFTGALGFCLVFRLRRRYLFAAPVGGLLTCGVYLAAVSIWGGILMPSLAASAFAAVYAEFLAWLMGAPTTLFLTPALLIPLIPGRPLYYASITLSGRSRSWRRILRGRQRNTRWELRWEPALFGRLPICAGAGSITADCWNKKRLCQQAETFFIA